MAKQLGEACADPSQCDSSTCADGVCCDRACTAGCERCNASGSVGTCVVRGDADKCGVQCVDGSIYRALTCDGSGPDCVPIGDGMTCGGLGCRVLASGKGVCAQCDATVACPGTGELCEDGVCRRGGFTGPTGCLSDPDCGSADLVCVAGACTPRQASAFASIEPLPLDESCGCRVPGAPREPALPASSLAMVCLGLVGLRRRLRARGRCRLLTGAIVVVLGAVTLAALGASACSPQEDLPANQACLDTSIALSAAVLACTDDYDAARRVGNGFEGKYRCNATDVSKAPRYYRCPADLRALPCADVKAAGEDYDQFLGRSNACRLLFSRPDGSALPPVASSSGGDGAGGTEATGQAGAAGAAGSMP